MKPDQIHATHVGMASEGVELKNVKALKMARLNGFKRVIIFTFFDKLSTINADKSTARSPIIHRPWSDDYQRSERHAWRAPLWKQPLMDYDLPKYYGEAWAYLSPLIWKISQSPGVDLNMAIDKLEALEVKKTGSVGRLLEKLVILRDFIDKSSYEEIEAAAADPRLVRRIADGVLKANLGNFLAKGAGRRSRHRKSRTHTRKTQQTHNHKILIKKKNNTRR